MRRRQPVADPVAATPAEALAATWSTIALGPGSLIHARWFPGDGIDCCSLVLLAFGHGVAGLLTLILAVFWRTYRRVPEAWLLALYWVPILTVVAAILLGDRRPGTHPVIRPALESALGVAAAIALLGAIRIANWLWRRWLPRRDDG